MEELVIEESTNSIARSTETHFFFTGSKRVKANLPR